MIQIILGSIEQQYSESLFTFILWTETEIRWMFDDIYLLTVSLYKTLVFSSFDSMNDLKEKTLNKLIHQFFNPKNTAIFSLIVLNL